MVKIFACAVIALAIPEAASAATLAKVVAKGSSSGRATAVAIGQATAPKRLSVRITASPNQKVEVIWNNICTKGARSLSDSGRFSVETPIVRSIPISPPRPASCHVTVGARALDGHGKVNVQIIESL